MLLGKEILKSVLGQIYVTAWRSLALLLKAVKEEYPSAGDCRVKQTIYVRVALSPELPDPSIEVPD
jgi:hypothetical protein